MRILCWTTLAVSLISVAAVEKMIVTIDATNGVQVVSERFLSLMIDPIILLSGNNFRTKKILNMAKSLAPAYLKLSGPISNVYSFQSSQVGTMDHELTVSEFQWIEVNNFVQEAGLKLIMSLNILDRIEGDWNSKNGLELIKFSDKKGYDISWQLGYELQELTTNITATQLSKDTIRLKWILDTVPRYQDSLVLGPDVTRFNTPQDVAFLKNFFSEAEPVLSGITWHPNFSQPHYKPENINLTSQWLLAGKEKLLGALDWTNLRKPLWICEKSREYTTGTFVDALVWAHRLGTVAEMGAHVIMREPNLCVKDDATPDFWVSLLHKELVGNVVLDTNQNDGNRSHLKIFSHCHSYKPGAITFIGISNFNTSLNLTLKLTSQESFVPQVVHQYVLTPGEDTMNPLHSRKTYLNGKLLTIDDDGIISIISPQILQVSSSFEVTIPPTSISFWVLADSRAQACLGNAVSKNISSRTSRPREQIFVEPKIQKHNEKGSMNIGNRRLESSMEPKTSVKVKRTTSNYMSDSQGSVTEGSFIQVPANINVKDLHDMKINKNNLNVAMELRGKRYLKENSGYVIPGLEPDVFQYMLQRNSINKLQRRDQTERYMKLRKILKDLDNVQPLKTRQHHRHGPETSSEENAYSFPTGDIYFRQHRPSYEERNQDYDYMDRNYVYEEEEPVSTDPIYYHAPGEYFENFRLSKVIPDNKLPGYGDELWEAETHVLMRRQKIDEGTKNIVNGEEDLIQESVPTEEEIQKGRNVTVRHEISYESDEKNISTERKNVDNKRSQKKSNSIETLNKMGRRAKVMDSVTSEAGEDEGNNFSNYSEVTTSSSVQDINQRSKNKESNWTIEDYFDEQQHRYRKTTQDAAKNKKVKHGDRINNGQVKGRNQQQKHHKMPKEDKNISQNYENEIENKMEINSGTDVDNFSDVAKENENVVKEHETKDAENNERVKTSNQMNRSSKKHNIQEDENKHAAIRNTKLSTSELRLSEYTRTPEIYRQQSLRRSKINPEYHSDEIHNTEELLEDLKIVETRRKPSRSYRGRRQQRDVSLQVLEVDYSEKEVNEYNSGNNTDADIHKHNIKDVINKKSPLSVLKVVKYAPWGKFEERYTQMKNNKLMTIQNSAESSNEYKERKEEGANIGQDTNHTQEEIYDNVDSELDKSNKLYRSLENDVDITKISDHIKREIINNNTLEAIKDTSAEVFTITKNDLKSDSKHSIIRGDNPQISEKMSDINNSENNIHMNEQTDRKLVNRQNMKNTEQMDEVDIDDNSETKNNNESNYYNLQNINKEEITTEVMATTTNEIYDENLEDTFSQNTIESDALPTEEQFTDSTVNYKVIGEKSENEQMEMNIDFFKNKSEKTDNDQQLEAVSNSMGFQETLDEIKSEVNENDSSLTKGLSDNNINKEINISVTKMPVQDKADVFKIKNNSASETLNGRTEIEEDMNNDNDSRSQRETVQKYDADGHVIPVEKEQDSSLFGFTEKIIDNAMEIATLGLGVTSKKNVFAKKSFEKPSPLQNAGKIIEKALSIGKLGLNKVSSTENFKQGTSGVSEAPVLNLRRKKIDNVSLKQKTIFENGQVDIKTQNGQPQGLQTWSLEIPGKMVGRKFPNKGDIKDSIDSMINNLGATTKKDKIFNKVKNVEKNLEKSKISYDTVNKADIEVLQQNGRIGNPKDDESKYEIIVSDIPMNMEIQEQEAENKEKKNILGGIVGVQYAEQTKNVSTTPKIGGLLMSKNAKNNFEDFRSNEVSVEEDISDSLVRKVKDVKHITTTNLNVDVLDNVRNIENLKLSSLNSRNILKAELEKKRLETLHTLEAYKTKLKEDIMRMNSELLRLKTASHLRKRRSLLSDSDDKRDNVNGDMKVKNSESDMKVNIDGNQVDDFWWKFIMRSSGDAEEMDAVKSMLEKSNQISQSMFFPKYGSESSFSEAEKLDLISVYVLDVMRNPFFLLFNAQHLPYPENIFEENSQARHPEEQQSFRDTNSNDIVEDKNISQYDTRDKSEEHYVKIKEMALPVFSNRPIIPQDPILSYFNDMPINENEIKFFHSSEEVQNESDENDIRELIRAQWYMSPLVMDTEIKHTHNIPLSILNYDIRETISHSDNAKPNFINTVNEFGEPQTTELDILHTHLQEVNDGGIKNISSHILLKENNVSSISYGKEKEHKQNNKVNGNLDSFAQMKVETFIPERLKRSISHDFDEKFSNSLFNSFPEQFKNDNWTASNMNEKLELQSRQNNHVKLYDLLHKAKLDSYDKNNNTNKIETGIEDVNLKANEIIKHFWGHDSMKKYPSDNNLSSKDGSIIEIEEIPYALHRYANNSKNMYYPVYNSENKYNTSNNINVSRLKSISQGHSEVQDSKSVNSNIRVLSGTLQIFSNKTNISSSNLNPQNSLHITYIVEEIPGKNSFKLGELSETDNNLSNNDRNGIDSKLVNFLQNMKKFEYPYQNDIPQEVKMFPYVDEYKDYYNVTAVYSGNSSITEKSDDKQMPPAPGSIQRIIKVISDHLVNFFHKIAPWNYFKQ